VKVSCMHLNEKNTIIHNELLMFVKKTEIIHIRITFSITIQYSIQHGHLLTILLLIIVLVYLSRPYLIVHFQLVVHSQILKVM
jgi:hypothetical protein